MTRMSPRLTFWLSTTFTCITDPSVSEATCATSAAVYALSVLTYREPMSFQYSTAPPPAAATARPRSENNTARCFLRGLTIGMSAVDSGVTEACISMRVLLNKGVYGWGLRAAVLERSGAKPPPSARTSDTSRINARVSSSASERRADIRESSADRTSRYVASDPSYRELTIWCASAAAATAARAAASSSSRDLRLVAASATSRTAVESVPLYVATAASYSARAPLNWP